MKTFRSAVAVVLLVPVVALISVFGAVVGALLGFLGVWSGSYEALFGDDEPRKN